MKSAVANPGGRGRPASATPEQVLAGARRQFLDGQRVDVQAIAAELGLGRATIYRWFSSRDGLLGAVLVTEVERLMDRAEREATGVGGERVLSILDGFIRRLVTSTPLRRFLEQEQTTALQMITSSRGPVQPKVVAVAQALIERAVDEDGYRPPVEPSTLAYAVVRLSEAFIYDDAVARLRGDADRLREVIAALLAVKPR